MTSLAGANVSDILNCDAKVVSDWKSSSLMKVLASIVAISFVGISALLVTSTGQQVRLSDQWKPTYQTTGNEGTISGAISFTGETPAPKRIDASGDSVCETNNRELFTEDIVVTEGKLANVMVFLRSGEALEWYVFDGPKADTSLDHRSCQFVPHVLGMRVQQTLKIANLDATYHNTHFLPRQNPDWNQTNVPDGDPLQHKFTQPEVAIPVKDNQHPWEKAYVSVFTHPFFAVSARDGSYQISGVPPGRYTIVAWHERFGEKTTEISIGVQERKTVDFAFSPLSKEGM